MQSAVTLELECHFLVSGQGLERTQSAGAVAPGCCLASNLII